MHIMIKAYLELDLEGDLSELRDWRLWSFSPTNLDETIFMDVADRMGLWPFGVYRSSLRQAHISWRESLNL